MTACTGMNGIAFRSAGRFDNLRCIAVGMIFSEFIGFLFFRCLTIGTGSFLQAFLLGRRRLLGCPGAPRMCQCCSFFCPVFVTAFAGIFCIAACIAVGFNNRNSIAMGMCIRVCLTVQHILNRLLAFGFQIVQILIGIAKGNGIVGFPNLRKEEIIHAFQFHISGGDRLSNILCCLSRFCFANLSTEDTDGLRTVTNTKGCGGIFHSSFSQCKRK